MSPEQILAKPPLDYRSDIFALGIIGYLMFAGRHPFAVEQEQFDPQALLYRTLIFEPEPVGQYVPNFPLEIWMLLAAMLAKKREQRPPDMLVLAKQLRELRERYLARSALPLAGLRSLGAIPAPTKNPESGKILKPGPIVTHDLLTIDQTDPQLQAITAVEPALAASAVPPASPAALAPAALAPAARDPEPLHAPADLPQTTPVWRLHDRLVESIGPRPGTEYLLVGDRIRVGREANAAVSINHVSVSRHHCELRPLPNGGWEVIDLDSFNGICVNGHSASRGILANTGDRLECGDVRLTYLHAGVKTLFRSKPADGAAAGSPGAGGFGGFAGAGKFAVAEHQREPVGTRRWLRRNALRIVGASLAGIAILAALIFGARAIWGWPQFGRGSGTSSVPEVPSGAAKTPQIDAGSDADAGPDTEAVRATEVAEPPGTLAHSTSSTSSTDTAARAVASQIPAARPAAGALTPNPTQP